MLLADGSSQLLMLCVIDLDDVAVDRLFSDVCARVLGAELRHLVPDKLLFLFDDAYFNTDWSCTFCHKESSSLYNGHLFEFCPLLFENCLHFTTDNFAAFVEYL